jgi:uncharacterized damage-inducible protein DinB
MEMQKVLVLLGWWGLELMLERGDEMRLKAMVACVVLGCCSGMAMAQMEMPKPRPLDQTISPAAAMDDLLGMFEYQALGVAKTMPADKYDFAPSAAAFAAGSPAKFEGVRTFAQQVKHLTEANYYFYGTISGVKPDVDMKAIDGLTKKDDIVAALAASFKFAHKQVATITAANAFVTIKGVDGMQTRASIAAFGVAHGYDHYGQMVEYLRMNGLVPPGSK